MTLSVAARRAAFQARSRYAAVVTPRVPSRRTHRHHQRYEMPDVTHVPLRAERPPHYRDGAPFLYRLAVLSAAPRADAAATPRKAPPTRMAARPVADCREMHAGQIPPCRQADFVRRQSSTTMATMCNAPPGGTSAAQ